MKPASRSIALLAFVLAPLAARAAAEIVQVQELNSSLEGDDAAAANPPALAAQIREVARRTLADARVLDEGAAGKADLSVSGSLQREDDGYRVSLELRALRSGKMVAAATALAATPEELSEATASAASDLFRQRQSAPAAAVAAIGPAVLPEVPAIPKAPDASAIKLDVDANVLVAYDNARTAEARGKEHPDEAAAAWRAVAAQDGDNPFRDTANERAAQWKAYGESKRALEASQARDAVKLRKVLPLKSVTDAIKLELLLRFARVYGTDKALPLLPLVPGAALRERAALAIGCEAKDASKCVALAEAQDKEKDAKGALDSLSRACEAGASDSCTEAGERLLRGDLRNPDRALEVLRKGCAVENASSCARLARVLEEGDGVKADAGLAAAARDSACAAGDGRSCRKIACTLEGTPDDVTRAADLWRKGCEHGDSLSCTLARAAGAEVSVSRPAMANSSASKGTAGAVTVSPPLSGQLAVDQGAQQQAPKAKADRRGGAILVGVSVLVATSAVYFALQGPFDGDHRHQAFPSDRRFLTVEQPAAAGKSHLSLALALGTAAVATGGLGTWLLTRPDPEKPKVSLGIAPGALVLSGTLP